MQTEKKLVITDEVNCPWLDVDELFAWKFPPEKFVKRFTGDEALDIFETIVGPDRLQYLNYNGRYCF